ncbi:MULTISPECIES: hypothetical protein [Methylorubrum]|nr:MULTISPECIES: hypothetical protein [Methylorubrum]UYW28999.1 hypothetical protein OKC48_10960 [Methylorubrum extorquens]UYW31285.1 hypothetical protein OKB92_20225 [Methylorubrum extorquens]BDL41891.1 hypothetical protein MSPGM_44810 [Methylorubrum sp. GM97]
MQPQVDAQSRAEAVMPSLPMALLGFATSTLGVVGIMTLLGSLV